MIISCLLALLLTSHLVWSSPVYSKTTEAFHRRNVFYAGGQYVFNETLGGTILVNQMYIEQLTPINGVTQRYPLVFLHGGGISGTVSTVSCFTHRGHQLLIKTVYSNGSISPMATEAGPHSFLKEATRSSSSTSGVWVDQLHKIPPRFSLEIPPRWSNWLSRHQRYIKSTIKRNFTRNGQG